MLPILPHSGQDLPAPLTLAPLGGRNLDLCPAAGLHLRDDEQISQLLCIHSPASAQLRGGDRHLRLQALPDLLLRPRGLQGRIHRIPDLDKPVPSRHSVLIQSIISKRLVHLIEQDIAPIILRAVGHGLPDFITGKGEDGRENLRDGIQNQPQRRLRAPPGQTVPLLTVEPVLDDIQIEAAELHHAEIIHRVAHHMELVALISRLASLHQGIELRHRPAVQLQHLLGAHQVRRVKSIQIPQAVPRRIPELQIVLT